MSPRPSVMRTVAFAVVTLLLASPAAAQRSGLLLGLSSDSGHRTIWIAPVGGKVVVAARQPMLVVPRNDGFHYVTTARWCQISGRREGPDEGPFVDQADVLTDHRIGNRSAAPDSGSIDCDVAHSIVGKSRDSVARVDSADRLRAALTRGDSLAVRIEKEMEGSDVCYFDNLEITFVSSRYVSGFNEDGTTEYCDPGRYTLSPHRFVRGDRGTIRLLPLLPAVQAKRLVARWEREKSECVLEDSPDDSWGIVRGFGGWQVAFETSGSTACRGQSAFEFKVVLPVPAAIARRDPVEKWLPALKAAVPKLDDVVVSPTGDLVMARATTRLSVFVPHGGRLGAAVLAVELFENEKVVMAEWATGANVDRWTRMLVDVVKPQ